MAVTSDGSGEITGLTEESHVVRFTNGRYFASADSDGPSAAVYTAALTSG